MVEICCPSPAAAAAALRAGADRIELCRDLPCGGTTPTVDELTEAGRLLSGLIPMNVLIRPRDVDFVYTLSEKRAMLDSIRTLSRTGYVKDFVVGALAPDGGIDVPFCREMVALCRELGHGVTFHRAIDCAASYLEAAAQVVDLSPDRILTSGGAPSAPEGAEAIAELVRMCGLRGGRTRAMAGAGVTADNVAALVRDTGVVEVHGSRTGILAALGRTRRDIRS